MNEFQGTIIWNHRKGLEWPGLALFQTQCASEAVAFHFGTTFFWSIANRFPALLFEKQELSARIESKAAED